MKNNRKTILRICIFGVIYCAALTALTAAEAHTAGASIHNLKEAIWYSVVTLTTVGYGDLTPVSTVGRIIGLVFVICSMGVLTFLFSSVFSLLNGGLLPAIQLKKVRSKRWFVFQNPSHAAEILGEYLIKEDNDSVIVFCQSSAPQSFYVHRVGRHQVFRIPMSVEECVELKSGDEGLSLFYLGENGWNNYSESIHALPYGCDVYCRTDACPNCIPANMKIFRESEGVSRLFWQTNPLKPSEQSIVIIGGEKYGEQILERALLINVFEPGRRLQYHVFGDFSHFQNCHHQLETVVQINSESSDKDSVWFYSGNWKDQYKILERADRIVICSDSDEDNLKMNSDIRTYFSVTGDVYIKLANRVAVDGATVFGCEEELFQPEIVMQSKLNALAIEGNERYRRSNPEYGVEWGKLPEFLRQSNIAAADHLAVKASILLGGEPVQELNRDLCTRAYQEYCRTREKKCHIYRRIEHHRWMRFCALYNWSYGERRDNTLRRHPLMVPFEELSQEQQKKDDDSWELLNAVFSDCTD